MERVSPAVAEYLDGAGYFRRHPARGAPSGSVPNLRSNTGPSRRPARLGCCAAEQEQVADHVVTHNNNNNNNNVQHQYAAFA